LIEIKDKHDCCGCSACVQVCPKQCISFEEDECGFRYPLVDKQTCVECHRCEKVCPVLNQYEERSPKATYASYIKDEEIRLNSSSGGLFSALAHYVITNKKGIVFGAAFDDNYEVHHIYVETIEELAKLRTSKYVQSRIENTYKEVKTFLSEGRFVLFTGTSCQIAGLKRFLGKEYDNLLTVDVICHGAPSPKVWRDYLEMLVLRPKGVDGKNTVSSFSRAFPHGMGINFRDKRNGWKKIGFTARLSPVVKGDKNSAHSPKDQEIIYEPLGENLFMRYFLSDMGLRPSCYKCAAKKGRSNSDITLGDFWGIENIRPDIDDDRGISAILVNTEKGQEVFAEIDVSRYEVNYADILRGNPSLETSKPENKYVMLFWSLYPQKKLNAISIVLRRMRPSFFFRLKRKIKHIIKRIIKS